MLEKGSADKRFGLHDCLERVVCMSLSHPKMGRTTDSQTHLTSRIHEHPNADCEQCHVIRPKNFISCAWVTYAKARACIAAFRYTAAAWKWFK